MRAKTRDTCRNSWCLNSPAKVNLGLQIVGRRGDGYHRIHSLFWPVGLIDEINLQPSPVNEVSIDWANDAPTRAKASLPFHKENLVTKVLEQASFITNSTWRVHIIKRIPIGGGLGGGSSNAGTLLRHFLTQGFIDQRAALELAMATGADVPFFLNPVPSWVSDIGETCEPIRLSKAALELPFIVVILPLPSSTAAVFEEVRNALRTFKKGKPIRNKGSSFGVVDLRSLLKETKNDLEPFVVKRYPLVGEVLAAMRSSPCVYAGMSGSGSTCFAIYRDDSSRENAFKVLRHFFRKNDCVSLKLNTHFHNRKLQGPEPRHFAPRRTSWKSLK